MKKLVTLLVLITSTLVFAQEKFDLNPESPNFSSKYVVINIDGLSAEKGFNQVNNWIKIAFDSPFDVIKAEIENEFIKISNNVDNLYYDYNTISKRYHDVNYDIVFCFKNNKVKFEITKIRVHYPKTVTSGGWEEIYFLDKDNFKRNGQLKPKAKQSFVLIQNHFNNLVLDLKKYLENPINVTSSDKW